MVLHFENNGPFIGVVSLERIIEVSHWGNIAVEEHVHIKHIGVCVSVCVSGGGRCVSVCVSGGWEDDGWEGVNTMMVSKWWGYLLSFEQIY